MNLRGQRTVCQGAARHYVHGDRGVQDFDLWGFFQEIPSRPFPWRRRAKHDFGPSKFGRNPDDGDRFKGRRVDVIGRSIRMPENETPIESVQRYLREAGSESARLLSERPAIVVLGRHISLDWRHLRWTQRQVCLDWHTAFSGI